MSLLRRFAVSIAAASVIIVVAGPSGSAGSAMTGPRYRQVITVSAAASDSTVAVLRTWQWTGTHYAAVFVATLANVGYHGVGPTHEGLGRTPVGVFTLTQAFGNRPNPGTRLPYFVAGPDDWWDENPASPAYNRHVHDDVSPGGDSENLYEAGTAYAHAVVINYNTDPVIKGAGSGFFLHVSMGVPTAGCVAINMRALIEIMRWLRPDRHPVISIGVGRAALAILS